MARRMAAALSAEEGGDREAEELLVRARDRAEEASRAKTDFLSRMSHELRTPLSAVLGFAELLQMDELDERQREYVGAIVKAGNHMVRVINDVLDISRIEAGKMTLSIEPLLVSSVLYDTVNLIRPLARSRDITVQTRISSDARSHVMADAQRLQQVLVNLGANAVKYNQEGGEVVFEVTATRRGLTRIAVTDTGRGIEPADIQRLFTPFERLNAAGTGVEGTGLGLAVSRSLMDAMKGKMGVESTPGEGSSFWLELPEASGSVPTAITPEQIETAPTSVYSSRQTLLYVEDTASNVDLVTRILALRPSITLVTTTHGHAAVDLAAEHSPGLILLDMHLPDLDGEQVLARLKGDERTRQIPVIAVSADGTGALIQRVLEGGAVDYITKPVNLKSFLTTVDGILSDRRSPAPG